MGWLWSSTPSSPPSKPSDSTSETLPSQPPPPSQLPSTPPPPPPPAPAPQKPRTLTRDEQADADLEAFLAELSTTSSTPHPPNSHPSPDSTPGQLSKLKFHPTSPESPSPDSLYPSTMSCSAAFDSAFYCQSLGGKFNDIYRYGELRSCSEHWASFWFCMRSKSLGAEERARKVQEHYREKAARVKAGRSSEDVWEVRGEPVVGAFSEALGEV